MTGSSCSTGFVGQPPRLSVAGSTSSVAVNARKRSRPPGGVAAVQRPGCEQLPGSSGHPRRPRCSQAWERPDASELQLLAAGTAAGQSITASLDVVVAPGSSAVIAYGGDRVNFTYIIGAQTIGPTSASHVNVPGLHPARLYQASVTVTPVGHPSAAVTLSSTQFGKSLPWPSGLAVQVASTVGANAGTGTAVASFPGLPGRALRSPGQHHVRVRSPPGERSGRWAATRGPYGPGPDRWAVHPVADAAEQLGAGPLRHAIACADGPVHHRHSAPLQLCGRGRRDVHVRVHHTRPQCELQRHGPARRDRLAGKRGEWPRVQQRHSTAPGS